MSLPVKRQHDETVEAGISKGWDGTLAESEAMTALVMESRPTKVARHDREIEKGELATGYVHNHKRDGAGLDVALGEICESQGELRETKPKAWDYVPEVKVEQEEMDPGQGDAQESKGDNEVKVEKDDDREGRVDEKDGGRESNEALSRAVKAEEPWLPGQEPGESWESNGEGQSKRSPHEGQSNARDAKELPEVKREDQEEEERKEKEPKEEKRNEDTQAQSVVPEKENERHDRDREKGDKEREKDRLRERDRPRDKEKEGGRGEKREKREKDRDRDVHRRERAEREERDLLGRERGEKEEGKGGGSSGVEAMDVERKPGLEIEERKPGEKEGRDRVRERDRDKERDEEGEGEKRKKRVRDHEKDRDSLGGVDTDVVGGEKDKDGVASYGVQQRKRMLRPRGQSNSAARDSRSRFRPKDNEGTQGRSENSVLMYRIGEGMPELAKLRKEFELTERSNSADVPGPTVEICIPAGLATTSNRQIRGSQLWGTDVYTDDSDIVAVLMHAGYYTPTATPPPRSISELRASIQILESQKTYTSTLRNSLRSRAWGGGSGCSYSVERCRIIKAGGGSVELEPCLTRTPAIAPTLAPAASERTVTTRAASSSAYRQQRFMQEVTIQYNLCNEPWLKYSMSIVADRGLRDSQFTAARLKKGDVLYVETHNTRYELAYDGLRTQCNGASTATSALLQPTGGSEKDIELSSYSERPAAMHEKGPSMHSHNGEKALGTNLNNGERSDHHGHGALHHNDDPHEHFRWSKCKRPLPLSSMRSKGVPLPAEFVEVLHSLAWEEVQWSPTSVWVRGTEYLLARAHFFSPQVIDMDE